MLSPPVSYRELGKEAREQQETLAHLKQAELQMAPENMDEDAWYPPPHTHTHKLAEVQWRKPW